MNISFKFYALILVKTLLRYLGRYMCVWCVLFPVTLAQAMRRIHIQGILVIFLNHFATLTADPSIVCAPQVCVGSVKLYSRVQFCTQKYSPSVQAVYIRTIYLYMNLYIYI